jgi:hypothetical protein
VDKSLADNIPEYRLNETLEKYQVNSIIHGHTGVRDITLSYDEKVINIHVPFDADDIKHKGLLITKEGYFSVDEDGMKKKIKKRGE